MRSLNNVDLTTIAELKSWARLNTPWRAYALMAWDWDKGEIPLIYINAGRN